MGFATFRVGRPGAHTNKNKNHKIHPKSTLVPRADDASPSPSPNPSCFTGGFYTSPTNGATLSAMDPLPITWDPTCLASTTHVDIYLFSPGSTSSRIHVWQRVPFSPGAYTASLMPRWWNATSAQSLQLAIVATDTPPFLTPLPAGPVFTATYTPPPAGTPPPPEADTTQADGGITLVGAPTPASGSSSAKGGRTAAAVLLPLLFVGLAVAAYLKWQRGRAQKETKRFSVAVDKRMSTISGDWKSMTPAGASAAIRNSMAVGRDSSGFAFGGVRPMSGVGVGHEQMTQVRTGTGVGLRGVKPPGDRERGTSRVSFATDTRVSRVSFADETRRTRAFHSAYIPPLPTRGENGDAEKYGDAKYDEKYGDEKQSNSNEEWRDRRTEIMSTASVYSDSLLPVENGDDRDRTAVNTPDPATLSPRQAQGPLTLTSDDIRARIHGQRRRSNESQGRRSNESSDEAQRREEAQRRREEEEEEKRQSEEMDAVMPALSMMRTGTTATDEYLFTPMPAPPTPTHPKPTASHSDSRYSPTSPAPTYTTTAPVPAYGLAPGTPTYGLAPSTPTYSLTPSSPFGATSPYGHTLPMTPSSPGVFGQQQQAPAPVAAMSPDEMMKAYAERKAAAAAAGRSPSAMSNYTSTGTGVPATGMSNHMGAPSAFPVGVGAGVKKGRKLSLKGVIGRVGKDKDRHGEGKGKVVISAPMQQAAAPRVQVETPLYAAHATGGYNTASVYSSGPGMAGVGARARVGVGAGAGMGMGAGAAYAIGEDEDEDGDAYGGTAN